ncbi:ATP synthase F1 subunit delta [Psychrilyobacter sp.]|uniref:ATP synthase F1 subunit delta n=1 Tax=Psychrilyobacter sp. TaxID=2586924 RepID=UPI003017A544
MIGAKVGKRYATAIYEIAAGEGKVKEVYETLNSIMETYLENLEFKNLVAHPLISKEKKKSFVKKIFPDLDEVEMDIVDYLIDKDRLLDIRSIVAEYLKIYYEKNQIVDVEATFALEPSEGQKENLIKKLKTKTGKKINLTVKVDSSIIAGGILKIGDEIIDGSIKRQLETLWKK